MDKIPLWHETSYGDTRPPRHDVAVSHPSDGPGLPPDGTGMDHILSFILLMACPNGLLGSLTALRVSDWM